MDEAGNPRPEFIHNAVPHYLKEQLVAQSASMLKNMNKDGQGVEGGMGGMVDSKDGIVGEAGSGDASELLLKEHLKEQLSAAASTLQKAQDMKTAAAAAAVAALAAVDERSAGTAIVMPESPNNDMSGPEDEDLDDDEDGAIADHPSLHGQPDNPILVDPRSIE